MREVTEFPHEVVEQEHVEISARDGVCLAARVWRPAGSEREPVPGILEAIPYRKRDLSAHRDSIHMPYLAGHGYACVRLDLRGTGDSEGVLLDEYLDSEHEDIEDVLAWLAGQPWCSGRTGMMGMSWGAFTALQVAARRPPSLGAIAVSSFTEDRYADDFHYMGGCMLSDNLAEAGTMFAHATCPPDPAVVGDRWRDMWLERLAAAGPWIDTWLAHQRRDGYWRRASLNEDYSAVRVPVLASSGWADGYSNAVLRVVQHLDVPRRGLIGPWSHRYPHLGEPGPAIDYLGEVIRWFDHWLRGVDNGVDAGPRLYAWMLESVPPATAYTERPGRWVGQPSWPCEAVVPTVHALAPHRIQPPGEPGVEAELAVCSPLSIGQFAGKWASYSAPPDLPYDQREEDGGSLVFDTVPLAEPCELLGVPTLDLELTVDRPVAMVAARLSDVNPRGQATRITFGLLNLTHRDRDDRPEPVPPGEPFRVRLQLNGLGQVIPAGHRIRLSLSTSYWPLAWAPAQPATLRVRTGTSTLTLPVLHDDGSDPVPADRFGEPVGAAPIAITPISAGEHGWTVSRDLVADRSTLTIVKDGGTVRYDDTGLEVGRRSVEHYSAHLDDPTSVRGDTEWTFTFARDGWSTRTTTRTTLTCTALEFVLRAELDAWEGDERVVSRNWHAGFPRDHV